MRKIIIAIDGPAASGKSTIAKRLSKKYNIHYLDTGAMYRSVAYKVIKEAVDIDNEKAILKLCQELKIEINFVGNQQITFMDGEDISEKIRNEVVSKMASKIATLAPIRLKLVEIQREFAKNNGCVMDGRDIGTHVLPDADFKFYVSASAEERAKRRFLEYQAEGIMENLQDLKKKIAERDQQDMTRALAPLQKAHDAILIDTTGMDIDEVVHQIIQYIET